MGSTMMIFRAPIMVNAHKPLDAEVCEELSYVIIYNLALSHQLKAIGMGPFTAPDTRRAYLKKAIRLYEHCQLIQNNRTIEIGAGRVHVLAILSSLRHIHHEIGLVQNVEICTQHLISTMMCIIDAKELDTLGCSVDG